MAGMNFQTRSGMSQSSTFPVVCPDSMTLYAALIHESILPLLSIYNEIPRSRAARN